MDFSFAGTNPIFIYLLFALGLVLIVKGGDYFVDAATWIAEVSGIPKFIVGATVVSFATTLPEMLVSIFAALKGNSEVAVGNAVGSVTANTGLIMCLSLVCLPCILKRKQFGINAVILLVAILGLFLFTFFDGKLSVVESIAIIALSAVFFIDSVRTAKNGQNSDATPDIEVNQVDAKSVALNILKFVGGAAGIVIGAQMLIDNGTAIAKMLHVPDAVIAATMIAIGTSLPELVTTITAIRKKESSISIGNIIGANIMDLTLIMPLCVLIQGEELTIGYQGRYLDIPSCLIITAAVMVPALILGRFTRWQGFLIGALYIGYLGIMFTCFG